MLHTVSTQLSRKQPTEEQILRALNNDTQVRYSIDSPYIGYISICMYVYSMLHTVSTQLARKQATEKKILPALSNATQVRDII